MGNYYTVEYIEHTTDTPRKYEPSSSHTYTIYRGYPGAPWWGYHYIYNPITKEDMAVRVERFQQTNVGTVSNWKTNEYIATIKVTPVEKKAFVYENTARALNPQGEYIGEIRIHGEEFEEEDDYGRCVFTYNM